MPAAAVVEPTPDAGVAHLAGSEGSDSASERTPPPHAEPRRVWAEPGQFTLGKAAVATPPRGRDAATVAASDGELLQIRTVLFESSPTIRLNRAHTRLPAHGPPRLGAHAPADAADAEAAASSGGARRALRREAAACAAALRARGPATRAQIALLLAMAAILCALGGALLASARAAQADPGAPRGRVSSWAGGARVDDGGDARPPTPPVLLDAGEHALTFDVAEAWLPPLSPAPHGRGDGGGRGRGPLSSRAQRLLALRAAAADAAAGEGPALATALLVRLSPLNPSGAERAGGTAPVAVLLLPVLLPVLLPPAGLAGPGLAGPGLAAGLPPPTTVAFSGLRADTRYCARTAALRGQPPSAALRRIAAAGRADADADAHAHAQAQATHAGAHADAAAWHAASSWSGPESGWPGVESGWSGWSGCRLVGTARAQRPPQPPPPELVWTSASALALRWTAAAPARAAPHGASSGGDGGDGDGDGVTGGDALVRFEIRSTRYGWERGLECRTGRPTCAAETCAPLEEDDARLANATAAAPHAHARAPSAAAGSSGGAGGGGGGGVSRSPLELAAGTALRVREAERWSLEREPLSVKPVATFHSSLSQPACAGAQPKSGCCGMRCWCYAYGCCRNVTQLVRWGDDERELRAFERQRPRAHIAQQQPPPPQPPRGGAGAARGRGGEGGGEAGEPSAPPPPPPPPPPHLYALDGAGALAQRAAPRPVSFDPLDFENMGPDGQPSWLPSQHGGLSDAGASLTFDSQDGLPLGALLTGLEPGLPYAVALRACNRHGCSAWSADTTAHTDAEGGAAGRPGAPRALRLIGARANEVELEWGWVAEEDDHGAQVLGWQLQAQVLEQRADGADALSGGGDGDGSGALRLPPREGEAAADEAWTDWQFDLAASLALGLLPANATAANGTAAAAAQPTDASAAAAAAAAAAVAALGAAGAAGWQLARASAATFDAAVGSARAARVRGLACEATVAVRARAFNSLGAGPWSKALLARTSRAEPPEAPRWPEAGWEAEDASSDGLRARWLPAVAARAEGAAGGGAGGAGGVVASGASAGASAVRETEVQLRLLRRGGSGGAASAAGTAAAPSNATASTTAAASATASATASEAASVAAWQAGCVVAGAAAADCSLLGLEADALYELRVRARTDGGWSGWSEPTTRARTAPAAACGRASDRASLAPSSREPFRAALKTCARGCWAERGCTRACLAEPAPRGVGLSAGCADCFAAVSECTKANCMRVCMFNGDGAPCALCSVEHCRAALPVCAGLPLAALS